MKITFMRPYLCFLLCIISILLACSVGRAQSGRRSPKPISPSPSTPLPGESETALPKSKPAQPQQKLLVGIDELSRPFGIPQYMSVAVWNGFLERFREVSSISISTDQNMNRKEAINRAKEETDSFVVLLRLEADSIGSSTSMSQVSPDRLVINYVIFSPVTGKTKGQGQVYARSSSGVLGGRFPTSRSVESQLHEAGREAADRVMPALNIGSPTIMRLFSSSQIK